MTMCEETEFDLIVVGAGLVGATCALSLASGGNGELNIALIEAGPETAQVDLANFDPRVVALTPHSQALFQRLGVWQNMVSQRVSPYQDMYVWDAEGTGHISFNAQQVQQACLGHIVENSVALAAIMNAVEQHPAITIIRPARVKQLVLPSDAQTQVLVILESGETVKGSLLVAADGANSKLRSLANLPTREWAYGQKAIVTSVQTAKSHQRTAYQRFLSSGPLAFLPLQDDRGQGTSSSIVWSADEALADRMMALNDEEFCEALGAAFEYRLGAITHVDKRFCIPLVQRHAIDYFAPGMALVGDAAHTLHPLAGQGVNLGLLDSEVLSSEILRAYQRSIPLGEPQILRRYQRQRKTGNLGMMAMMEGFKRLFASDELGVRYLRNAGMKRLDHWPLLKNTIIRQAMGL